MQMPLVSIVIPCYNAERYVGEAIESALRQTYPSIEVIVVDDGSNDASLDRIRSFGSRVHWEAGPNRGANHARNRGIALSRGECIQFLDADDVLDPRKIAVQMELQIRESRDLFYTDWTDVLVNGEIRTYVISEDIKSDPVCFLLKLPRTILISAPVHRKADLVHIGMFDEKLPCCQEYDLNLRLAAMLEVRFRRVADPLFTVRQVRGSVSSNYIRLLDYHLGIMCRLRDILQTKDGLTDERSQRIAQVLATDARAYLRRGHRTKSDHYFAEARNLHHSGGLGAFNRAYASMHRLAGPHLAEWLVNAKRRLCGCPAVQGESKCRN